MLASSWRRGTGRPWRVVVAQSGLMKPEIPCSITSTPRAAPCAPMPRPELNEISFIYTACIDVGLVYSRPPNRLKTKQIKTSREKEEEKADEKKNIKSDERKERARQSTRPAPLVDRLGALHR